MPSLRNQQGKGTIMDKYIRTKVAHCYQNFKLLSKLSFNFILHSNLISNQVKLEIKFISTRNQILFQSGSNSTIL